MSFSFRFFNPVRINFGVNSLQDAGKMSRKYGKNALIVTGKSSMHKSGVLDKLIDILQKSDVRSIVFSDITPNPTVSEIDAAAAIARTNHIDLIIGLGGGSALDSAKAIAVAAKGDRSVWEYLKIEPESALPVITIVSTSGTGSEVNRFSVMTNAKTGEKPGFGYECMYPKEAIIDPVIMQSMPAYVTATTGFDVFVHSLEAYTGRISNPIADSYCEKAFALLKESLVTAYNEPENIKARTDMAAASALAGLAIDSAGVGIIHALEHPVSGNFPNIAHGAGLAALTVESMKLNINDKTAKEKYARAAHIFGKIKGNKTEGDMAYELIETVKKMLKDVNLNVSLEGLKVSEDKLEKIAKEAFTTMDFAVLNNPVQVDENGALKLLKDSFK
ncbi:MAG: iron-containing alcohol dehydrogenase [Candidatus Acididesulfobacter guangdongensis]|uniref:Iron-containing alcohol dehydrogenase n=1 Tax=Acididesulfobacter guangdongensis TaxID=2597225 RepID=A0A519BG98_ACIG2|nr:MAG: iron-containing alcohol dehydrogenase [Candidatus Acididesulfobacter guangdongensis]